MTNPMATDTQPTHVCRTCGEPRWAMVSLKRAFCSVCNEVRTIVHPPAVRDAH
jgi:hypothetical protein